MARKKRRIKLLDEEVLSEEQSSSSITSVESTANLSAEVSSDAPTEIDPQILCRTKHMFSNEAADNLQATQLVHCLSSESFRRWCTYEWFYSAVGYPWFMNNEFLNCLNFAKLSHLSRLTRSEWSTIRSFLGNPHRFSNYFLAVEEEKLEDYCENGVKYDAELSDGLLDSLSADLAWPFSVGQHVIVRHPSSRELCDAKVVPMEWDCYKVQFDTPVLGVDIVKNTDFMPVNWLDNLPDDLKKRNSLSNNAHGEVDIEHILELTPKESWGHIKNGISGCELSCSPHVTSDEQLKAADIIAVSMSLLVAFPMITLPTEGDDDDMPMYVDVKDGPAVDLQKQITAASDSNARLLEHLVNALFRGTLSTNYSDLSGPSDAKVEATGSICAFLHIKFNLRWPYFSKCICPLPAAAPGWLLPVSVFCPIYKYMLKIVDNEEFYEQEKPLSLEDLKSLILVLMQGEKDHCTRGGGFLEKTVKHHCISSTGQQGK